MGFISRIQERNAEITALIAALVAERDDNDAAIRALVRLGFDDNSAASTQELPRPMEGAADRGEVRPGLAASNSQAKTSTGNGGSNALLDSAPATGEASRLSDGSGTVASIPAPVLSQGEREADAVDLTASADQSTAARTDVPHEAGDGVGESLNEPAQALRDTEAGTQAPPVDTHSPETAIAGEVGPETVGASPAPFANGFVPPAAEMQERTAKRVEVAALHHSEPWLSPEAAAARLLIPVVNLRIFSSELEIAWSQPRPSTAPAPAPVAAKAVTLRDKVIALHKMHPTWGAGMVSRELGCAYGSASSYLAEARRVTKDQPAPINREVA